MDIFPQHVAAAYKHEPQVHIHIISTTFDSYQTQNSHENTILSSLKPSTSFDAMLTVECIRLLRQAARVTLSIVGKMPSCMIYGSVLPTGVVSSIFPAQTSTNDFCLILECHFIASLHHYFTSFVLHVSLLWKFLMYASLIGTLMFSNELLSKIDSICNLRSSPACDKVRYT